MLPAGLLPAAAAGPSGFVNAVTNGSYVVIGELRVGWEHQARSCQSIGDREASATFPGSLTIGRQLMEWFKQRPGVNPMVPQSLCQLIPVAAELLPVNQAASQPGRWCRPGSILTEDDARNSHQFTAIEFNDLLPSSQHFMSSFQLAAEDGGGDIGHSVIEADNRKMVATVGIHALTAEHRHPFLEQGVVQADRTTLATGEHLVAKE